MSQLQVGKRAAGEGGRRVARAVRSGWLSRAAAYGVLHMWTLAWLGAACVCLASAIWALSHLDRLEALASNKVEFEERIASVKLLLIVGGALAGAGILWWRKGWPRPRWLIGVVLSTPVFVALWTPQIESRHPILTQAYIVLVAVCLAPALRAWLGRPRPLALPPPGQAAQRVSRWRVTAPWLIMGAAWVVYTVILASVAIADHHAMNTQVMDLAVYDNIFYQSSHGRPLACTFHRGGTHITSHFDPILVLLSPLYLLYPRAELLLVLQPAWCGAAVFPVFLLARHHLRSNAAALAVALVFLLQPALHGSHMYDFHSLTLLGMPFLFALYFLETGRFKAYYCILPLLLAVREDVPLLLIFLGLYAISTRGKPAVRAGWITILVAALYFVFAKVLVMGTTDPLHHEGGYSFSYYFKDLIPHGKGTGELILSLLTNPAFVVRHVLTEPKLQYVLQLLLPLGFLPLLARRGKLLVIYGFAFTLLASRTAVFSPYFQYTTLLYPSLTFLAILGLRRIRDDYGRGWSGTALGVVVVLSVLSSAKFGALVANDAFHSGFHRPVRKLVEPKAGYYAGLRRLIEQFPADASVTATREIAPHISNRKDAYEYGSGKKTDYMLIDIKRLGRRQGDYQRRLKQGELRRIDSHGSYHLYRWGKPGEFSAQPK